MAHRTPEWIYESFKTFRPGVIPETEVPGTWLSVRTDTPGRHRFTDAYPVNPKPHPDYGEGMYVMVDGPGFVSFKLNHLVKSLFFGLWSPNGTTGTVHARYFGDNGNTFEAFDYPVVQTGQFVYFIAPAKGIAGVEISRNASSPQHVCIDNFSTFDEEQLERVKALKKTSLTIDDILNIRR
jgi:hypothetical protein